MKPVNHKQKGTARFTAYGHRYGADGWTECRPLFKFFAIPGEEFEVAQELRGKGYGYARHGGEEITEVR